MTSESDEQFVERMEYIKTEGWDCMTDDEADRLFALARRGAAVQWRPISARGSGNVIFWPIGGKLPTHFIPLSALGKPLPLPPPPAGEPE